jgi:hypothetical protein
LPDCRFGFQEEAVGYDIHVTRAASWRENEKDRIQAKEWRALVEGDPELHPDPTSGEHAVRWRADDSPPGAWFDWYAGNVFTTNPDKAVLSKALQIASLLDAHVEGDDGTIYCGADHWRKLPV